MFQKVFYILCFVVVGLSFQSCYRDSEVFVPKFVQIDEYINALKRPSQTFTINAAETSTFTTAGKAVFRFPSEGYYYENDGNTVSGDITVYVKEIYRKGDMIRENVVTVSTDNELLGSGGMFQLEMQQNGKKVLLRDDKKINIDIPAVNTGNETPLAGMQVYNGAVRQDSAYLGFVTWKLNNLGDIAETGTWIDGIDQLEVLGYRLTTAGYQWINCDYFASFNSTVTCSFNLPAIANPQNTRVFIMYDGLNVMQPAIYNSFAARFVANIESGLPVSIVVLHVDNDKELYYSFQQETIQTGGTSIEVPLEKTSVAQLKDFLDSL